MRLVSFLEREHTHTHTHIPLMRIPSPSVRVRKHRPQTKKKTEEKKETKQKTNKKNNDKSSTSILPFPLPFFPPKNKRNPSCPERPNEMLKWKKKHTHKQKINTYNKQYPPPQYNTPSSSVQHSPSLPLPELQRKAHKNDLQKTNKRMPFFVAIASPPPLYFFSCLPSIFFWGGVCVVFIFIFWDSCFCAVSDF